MLTLREYSIERYLVRRVKKAGGECHKRVTPGRRHSPDREVLVPRRDWSSPFGDAQARVVFVETKAPKKGPRPGQKREHKRLRDMGFEVRVIDSKALVDHFVKYWFGG